MARLILPIIAIILVWMLLRYFKARRNQRRQQAKRTFAPTVQCHQCGVFLDKRLAWQDAQGHHWCELHHP